MKKTLYFLLIFLILSCSSKQKEFYESGEIKSIGTYKSGFYTECCFAGPCDQPYDYKVGKWKYYYKNGQLKAVGSYEIKPWIIQTNCEGGDTIKIGYPTQNWEFFSLEGNKINSTPELINEIEENYEFYQRGISKN